jgi:hypothetical protein
MGLELLIDEDGSVTRTITRPATIYRERFSGDVSQYGILRTQLLRILDENGMSVEEYAAREGAARRRR